MNLTPAGKNVFTISFVLDLQNKILCDSGILLNGDFNH